MTRKLCTFKILDWRYFYRTLCAQQNVFSQKYQTFSFSAFFVFVSKFLNFFEQIFQKRFENWQRQHASKILFEAHFADHIVLYIITFIIMLLRLQILSIFTGFRKETYFNLSLFLQKLFQKTQNIFLIILSFHFVHKTHLISFTKSKQIDQRNWLNKWIFIKHNFWLFP